MNRCPYATVRNSIDTKNKGRQCFELFGYDFMVRLSAKHDLCIYLFVWLFKQLSLQLDEDFRTWLIEVNTNPYLGVQNAWHGE